MPTRRQVQQFAQGLSQEFLECRQYGHAWKPYTVDSGGGLYEVTIRCSRCTSEGVDTVNRRGQRIRPRRPRYAQGYLASGMGRMTGEAASVIRMEMIQRLTTEPEAPGA